MTYKEFLQDGWDHLTRDKEELGANIASIAVMLFILLSLATILAVLMGSFTPYLVVLSIFFGAIFVVFVGAFIFGSVYWLINRKDM